MRRITIYGFALILVVLLGSRVPAQSDLDIGDVVVPGSGKSAAFPSDVNPTLGNLGADIGLPIAGGSAFLKEYRTVDHRARGARDVAIFREVSPAVVLIINGNTLGSGSLIEDGTILTNWHVVRGALRVNVIFKPVDAFGKPSPEDMTIAVVVKIDQVSDLALLEPYSVPSRLSKRIKIDQKDNIEVGADVHAIGHPTGQAWTYTNGIVSQIRPNYEWKAGPRDIQHRATVIQTQTPISPGNSGGPLLADDGQLVGVNSFGTIGAEGLNFAVSAKDVRRFLKAPSSEKPIVAGAPCVLFEGRDDKNTAYIRRISLKCDDWVDIVIVVPDDKRKPIMALIDSQRRNKVDGIVLDERRTGKWNVSYWDPKLDGTFPLRGRHPNGELLPTSQEPRCGPRSRPLANFRCA